MSTLGQLLRESRKILGLTQQALENELQLGTASISRWEQGKRPPSRRYVLAIEERLRKRGEPRAGETADKLRRAWDAGAGSTEAFHRFIGAEAVDHGFALVYPEFRFSGQALRALEEVHPQFIFEKAHPVSEREHRIDVKRIVAANDLEGLAAVASLLQSHEVGFKICVDGDPAHLSSDKSFISFGLSSNSLTQLYLDLESGTGEPLFELSANDDGSAERIVVRGQPTPYESTSSTCYGIIVRVSPRPREAPDRRWFLCAGLGAPGTPGAAQYLASYWRTIHEQVGSADFIVVVSVKGSVTESARSVYTWPADGEG
jgi:transcriptional regulator with XRE-family HTH domain